MKKLTSTFNNITSGNNSDYGANKKKLKISLNSDNTFYMQIFDEEVSQCYDLLIDDRYLKCRQDLSNFFTTPLDMHYTLVQLEDQIIMTSDYNIILNLNLSASKLNITKQFIFQLELNVDKTLLQQRQKIDMLKEQVAALHGELDLQKEKNRQKEDNLFQQISEIKQQKTKLKYQLEQANEEIEKINALLLQKQVQNQELRVCLQDRKEQITSYESTENINKSRLIELEQTIKMLEQTKIKKDLLVNQTNPHYYLFHYLHSDVGTIRIKKTGLNGWANVISNALLPQTSPTIFQMKVNHTIDGSIAMGICNNMIFGSKDLNSPMATTYFVHDGRIFQKGTTRSSGPPILVGQTLKLLIDWQGSCLRWFNGQTKVGEALIDPTFKLNNIFMIVRMFWKQDQIELK